MVRLPACFSVPLNRGWGPWLAALREVCHVAGVDPSGTWHQRREKRHGPEVARFCGLPQACVVRRSRAVPMAATMSTMAA